MIVPNTSPSPGSFPGEKVAFLAALKAAERSWGSPLEVRQEITLPVRFTRTVTIIVPPVPAALALLGYSADGTFTAAPARDSLTTGAFGSALVDEFKALVDVGDGVSGSALVAGDSVAVDDVEEPTGVAKNS